VTWAHGWLVAEGVDGKSVAFVPTCGRLGVLGIALTQAI